MPDAAEYFVVEDDEEDEGQHTSEQQQAPVHVEPVDHDIIIVDRLTKQSLPLTKLTNLMSEYMERGGFCILKKIYTVNELLFVFLTKIIL